MFCDIDDYYTIDLDKIEELITEQTRAILWVDLYGQSPDIDKIIAICKKHGLYSIQDSAQSFGYNYQGRCVGSIADITCISFNPVKNLGAIGDAGCVLGKKHLVDLTRMYRDHGRRQKFSYEAIGYNCRIDNLQARVVQAKLPYLNEWLARKHEIAEYYSTNLNQYYPVPQEQSWGKHTYYVYVLEHENRDKIREVLLDRGIQTNIHYPNPVHTTPAYQPWTRSLPRTEQAGKNVFSIPCYYSLTDQEVEHIVDTLKAIR